MLKSNLKLCNNKHKNAHCTMISNSTNDKTSAMHEMHQNQSTNGAKLSWKICQEICQKILWITRCIQPN